MIKTRIQEFRTLLNKQTSSTMWNRFKENSFKKMRKKYASYDKFNKTCNILLINN